MDYQPGHTKRDPATGAVAVRTNFLDSGITAFHAWLVATIANGAVNKLTAEVARWDDLYVPPVQIKRIDSERVVDRLTINS